MIKMSDGAKPPTKWMGIAEGDQVSDILTPAITPSAMPIHLVGVLAPSDILIIGYF